MTEQERLRLETVAMVRAMGRLIVPAHLFEQARALLPEVADLIVKSERLPLQGDWTGFAAGRAVMERDFADLTKPPPRSSEQREAEAQRREGEPPAAQPEP